MTSVTEPGTAAATANRRWFALATVCAGSLAMFLDMTIVNVALPTIGADLGFSQASLAWVVDAYLVVFGGFLLLGGRLGDLLGYRRVFLGGVALFTLASLACGLADSQGTLVAARAVQGLGAAASSSVTVAMIVRTFSEQRERATAMSAYTFVASGGASLGLVLGGVLTQLLDWHWIFFVNVPLGIATIFAGRRFLDVEVGARRSDGVDVTGALLVTSASMLGIYAIISVAQHGWASRHTLVAAALSIALLIALVLHERRAPAPIIPPRVLALRGVAVGAVVRSLVVIGGFGTFFIGALYLERIQGYETIATGLAFLPQTVGVAVMSAGPAAAIMHRLGARTTLFTGLGLSAAGLAVFATAGADTAYFPVLGLSMLLIGVGGGLTFLALLTVSMSDVPPADAGMGSAISTMSSQIGAGLGVAVLGTAASTRTAALLPGHSQQAALLAGYHLALLIALGCSVAAAGIALALPRD